MTLQLEDDGLDPYEAWARDRLTPLLGPLRKTDRRGGPPGLHDFEADLPDGSIAALEVTGEVDARRRDLASSAERHLSSVTLSDSESLWVGSLAADARVNAITPPEKLRRLLGELEASGRRNAYNIGDYRDPFVARLRALGIESVYAVKARAGSEGMLVQAGSYGGRGWDGAAIDRWLGEFLASAQGTNKVSKLGRAQAAERHLVIVLDPFSPAGIGIPLGLEAAASVASPITRCPRSCHRSRSPTCGCFPRSGRRGTAFTGRVMGDGRSSSPRGPDELVRRGKPDRRPDWSSGIDSHAA
jgi:hypothetical protein